MKKFKKNEQGFFVCEECGEAVKNKRYLNFHLNKIHSIDRYDYFMKWIIEEGDDRCKICGKKTIYKGTKIGYANTCSKECENKYKYLRTKEAIFKKYGVICSFERKESREKGKITLMKLYGVENISQNEDIKRQKEQTCEQHFGCKNPQQSKEINERTQQTNLNKYGNVSPLHGVEQIEKKKASWMKNLGVDNPFKSSDVQEKAQQTLFKNLGVKHPAQAESVRKKMKETNLKNNGFEDNFKNPICIEKRKQTWIKNLGVEHPSQDKDVIEKQQKSAFKLKQFRDTDIWYQGSYELDFLEKFYDICLNIQRASSIKYKFNGKNRVYHPDFYIPSLNLVIECKNKYLLKRDKDIIEAKEKATITSGFNYVMILDKDYSNFVLKLDQY